MPNARFWFKAVNRNSCWVETQNMACLLSKRCFIIFAVAFKFQNTGCGFKVLVLDLCFLFLGFEMKNTTLVFQNVKTDLKSLLNRLTTVCLGLGIKNMQGPLIVAIENDDCYWSKQTKERPVRSYGRLVKT